MYKGARYRVSCEELGAMVWTKEASVSLANAWWERKLAELTGPSPAARVLQAVEEMPIEKLREMMERGDAVKRILAELPFVTGGLEAAEVAKVVGAPVPPGLEAERLHEVVAKVAGPAAAKPDRTFKYHAERFLTLARGSVKPMTYVEIRDTVRDMYSAPGISEQMDVGTLDEEKVEGIYLWLRDSGLAPVSKKKRWAICKRLVRYLWENGLIALPRNLESRSLKFTAPVQAVKTYPPEEVRRCLAKLNPRMKLWALLSRTAELF